MIRQRGYNCIFAISISETETPLVKIETKQLYNVRVSFQHNIIYVVVKCCHGYFKRKRIVWPVITVYNPHVGKFAYCIFYVFKSNSTKIAGLPKGLFNKCFTIVKVYTLG